MLQKKEIIEKLKEQIQKEKIRWKQYRRKVLDSNIQDNVWPLHIATMFISIQTTNKNIYGPPVT
ncbi:hypothetical protein [Spiroplasma endosymbiont of Labia minor]|uniref:hypothetical protein n=1 Tax=Spiroplasma endosymbiont of Labia minor TaxID=3066305 RepID=UPI0030D52F0C